MRSHQSELTIVLPNCKVFIVQQFVQKLNISSRHLPCPVTFVGHIYNTMEGALNRLIFKVLLTLYNLHLYIVMNYAKYQGGKFTIYKSPHITTIPNQCYAT